MKARTVVSFALAVITVLAVVAVLYVAIEVWETPPPMRGQ